MNRGAGYATASHLAISVRDIKQMRLELAAVAQWLANLRYINIINNNNTIDKRMRYQIFTLHYILEWWIEWASEIEAYCVQE